MILNQIIESAAAMEAYGEQLAQLVPVGSVIYLAGELGSGKTTLVRGFLRGLGYTGHVKSPTFTLVEPYDIDNKRIYHFDLYRITDPDELEYVGLREYFDADAICLLEWPERGGDRLPVADLSVLITYQGSARALELAAHTDAGRRVLNSLS
jgi:tRNA threonylcarbamoyladenosine biosynthesis protein TsaE